MSSASTDSWTAAEREALEAARDPVLQHMLAEERVESSTVDTRLLGRLLAYVKPHTGLGILSIALATIEALLMTAPAWLVGLAVDVARGDTSRDGALELAVHGVAQQMTPPDADALRIFAVYGGIVGAVWALRWAFGAAMMYTVQKLGQHVVHDLRCDTYRHIVGMDLGYFHKNPVGRLVNRTTFDVQSLSELFSDAFAEGARDLLFVLILIGVMFALDPVLAAILVASFPLLVLVGAIYRHFARPAMRTMTAVQSRMNAWLAENLAGMRENHLYRREARRRAEFRALTEAHQASVTRVIQSWGVLRPAMMAVSAVATTLVLLLGYERVVAGTATVGVLLTFLQYTTRIWIPIRNLTEKLSLIQTALTAAERIADVLDTPTAMTDPPGADEDLRVERGDISFDGVRFRYPTKPELVLDGIDFEVVQGQMLALVGDTGAGKSTVAHLLSRFYDVTEGSVRIDGHDVRDYTLRRLRSGIAIVPQDVVIFAGTVRDNITLGANVDDARIHECLDAVLASDIVKGIPGGLDGTLEEGGRTLSAGQRQLLSFARALVANPPILLLDEATANVDTETEARIQQALATLTAGRTSVVIAHRLSTIRHADRILVLRHGHVIEDGRHDELIALDGEYARLVRLHLGRDAD